MGGLWEPAQDIDNIIKRSFNANIASVKNTWILSQWPPFDGEMACFCLGRVVEVENQLNFSIFRERAPKKLTATKKKYKHNLNVY